MTDFDSLERRFFMRYIPSVLLAETEDQRQRALGKAISEPPFGSIHDKAKAFFASHSPDSHRREVLTRLFGVGDQRLYHAEHNLMDIPMREMPTLQAMVHRLATINVELMAEDDETLDKAAHFKERHAAYNLWLTDLRNGKLRFIVANSITMQHAFLAQEMLHDAMHSLIPREMEVENSEAGFQLHVRVEGELHQQIWREMTRRCLRGSATWIDQMDTFTDRLGYAPNTVAIEEKIDERGYPATTYCFFSAEPPSTVRLACWDTDIDPLPKVTLKDHLETVRAHFADPIVNDVTALYQRLAKEVQTDAATPLYTRDTGNKITLSHTFFDKP